MEDYLILLTYDTVALRLYRFTLVYLRGTHYDANNC